MQTAEKSEAEYSMNMQAPVAPKFAMLLDLAKETSSEKRRDLLRQITDMFVAQPDQQTSESYAALDSIAMTVVSDVTSEVRMEIAKNLAESALPLGKTARQLSLDKIDIAGPVIQRWHALTQKDLLDIVAAKSQDHLMAVTKRSDIEEPVSDALVNRGEDLVVASLLANGSAKIGRTAYEKISQRAENSAALQESFARRKNVPIELMGKLYNSVSNELRKEIVGSYQDVPTEILDVALEKSWLRVEKLYSAQPDGLEDAQVRLKRMQNAGELKPAILERLLREGEKSRAVFFLAFAKLADVDYHLIYRLFEELDLDAVALLCRAAGFDQMLFGQIAQNMAKGNDGSSNIGSIVALYQAVPIETAMRAVRFWKVRALV